MADSRFYNRQGPFTLEQLAKIGQCEIVTGNAALEISDVAPLDEAIDGTIGVFHNPKYSDSLQSTKATACIIGPENLDKAPEGIAKLVSATPYRSYAMIASAFYQAENQNSKIHPTAVIDESATVGENCRIDAYAVIGPGVTLGDNVVIGSHTVIEENCQIGDHTVIDQHVSIQFAIIGNHVHIKPGARIGQSGFGFHMDEKGHVPVPQLGRVVIHDHVEIGSNSTVDRGSGKDTVVGVGTRIDNLVQVAHNVSFGKGCVMVAQSGVSGSTQFGDFVACGGQVGIIDHLKIGTGARLAAQSGIMSNVEPGAVLCGSPAVPIKTFYRQVSTLQKITKERQIKE